MLPDITSLQPIDQDAGEHHTVFMHMDLAFM